MLFPQHPQPVARRREVAAAVVSTRQAAAIAPGHVLVVPAVAASPAGPPARLADADMAPALSRFRHDTPV